MSEYFANAYLVSAFHRLEIFMAYADDTVSDYPQHYWDFIACFVGHLFVAFSDSAVKGFFQVKLPELWKNIKSKTLEAFVADVVTQGSKFNVSSLVISSFSTCFC